MKSIQLKDVAPVVLRIGIALVYLWFGVQQLFSATRWLSYIPDFVMNITGLSALTLVHFNGAFELVFGLCMLFGFYTRISAALLALHMFDIVFIVGLGATGVRDFGVAIGTTAVFLYGVTRWSIDAAIAARLQSQESK